jgi:hypothetical protein
MELNLFYNPAKYKEQNDIRILIPNSEKYFDEKYIAFAAEVLNLLNFNINVYEFVEKVDEYLIGQISNSNGLKNDHIFMLNKTSFNLVFVGDELRIFFK